ncbi:hypothetical protein CHGG_01572 [Chaetomium globosum CBS 148.51]|uniref:Uncharacterized protein n=1 Tax=Chaetomium globosum (strain ATCC 6205 / CBS 148.51 / DSM 1962 / NBRC 6347 / NRRL 1970) TaxID=306901 RepID=Q2HDY2_CHAGB|nr:uncharacterized protein CHGG_01572 [Chaetomium globosum CBS 148.51]EAQ93337.1 hypothetical protein CHGG_01572 [Chaetomium globosum CBS 148.51]
MRILPNLTLLASLTTTILADPIPPNTGPSPAPAPTPRSSTTPSRPPTTTTTPPQNQTPPPPPTPSSPRSNPNTASGITPPLFASLERAARLVDITYCVGTTGISPPFSCVSRCRDFPSLRPAADEYVPYPAPPGEGGDNGDGRCDNCTVHMGFMASWRNAREVVIPALGPRGRSIPVTGLGEGDQGEDVAYRRVTHVGDPVPLLPLTEWGYRSHAGEIYIEKSNLPPGPEDLRLCRGDNDSNCMGGAETADWLHSTLRPEEAELPGSSSQWRRG